MLKQARPVGRESIWRPASRSAHSTQRWPHERQVTSQPIWMNDCPGVVVVHVTAAAVTAHRSHRQRLRQHLQLRPHAARRS